MTRKAIGVILPKPVGSHMKLDMALQNLAFALLGFYISLVQSFFSKIPILLIVNGNVTLCHCMLETYNMSLHFIAAQGYNFSTDISLVSKIGPLNSADTGNTM